MNSIFQMLVDANDSERRLSDLIEALQMSGTSKIWQSSFQFFHSVITKSRMSPSVDCWLWCFIWILLYLVIIFDTVDLDLGMSLVDHDSSQYFDSKLGVQQAAAVAIIVSTIFLMYELGTIVMYRGILSSGEATVLHFCFEYMPIFLVVFLGAVFGALVLSNIPTEVTQFPTLILAVGISVLFCGIVAVSMVYQTFSRYSLSMGMGQFEHWKFPLTGIDYAFIFSAAANMVIRALHSPSHMTFIAVTMLIYGGYRIFYMRTPIYVRMLPEMLACLYGFLGIGGSIEVMIDAWYGVGTFGIDIFIIILLVAVMASMALTRIAMNRSRFSLVDPPTRVYAIRALRLGIVSSDTAVANEDFLKFVCRWRFSPELLTDVMRLCVVINRSVDDIMVPKVAVSGFTGVGLKFMAYQVKMIKSKREKDGDPSVESAIDDMKAEMAKIRQMLRDFWTNDDYNYMTMMDMADELNRASQNIEEIGNRFPQSQSISKLYDEYVNSVTHTHKVFYNNYPESTIYGFLATKGDGAENRPNACATELETYLEKLGLENVLPTVACWIITIIASMVVAILYTRESRVWSEREWEIFTNMTSLFEIIAASGYEQLSIIDSLIEFPNTVTVAEILKISENDARNFVTERVQRNINLSHYCNYVMYLENVDLSFDSVSGCPNMSMSLLLKHDPLVDKMTSAMRRCRMLHFLLLRVRIETLAASLFDGLSAPSDFMHDRYGIFTVIYIAIACVAFVVFSVVSYRGYNAIFNVVCLMIANKPKQNEHKRFDLAFSHVVHTVLFLCLIVLFFSLYVAHYVSHKRTHSGVHEMLNQIRAVSNIAHQSMSSLAYTEVNFTDHQAIDMMTHLIHQGCDVIRNETIALAAVGIRSEFQDIHPLSDWESFQAKLIEFASLLKTEGLVPMSFEFLYCRFIYLKSMSRLYTETIPSMISEARHAMQRVPAYFMFLSIIIFPLMILCFAILLVLLRKRKIWYSGCSVIIKEAICADPSKFYVVRGLIEKSNRNPLEEIPFPVVIRERDGPILYANDHIRPFTEYAPKQVTGQKLDHVFNIKNGVLEKENTYVQLVHESMEPCHEFIIMKNVTNEKNEENEYNSFIEKMKLSFEAGDSSTDMFCVEARYRKIENASILFDEAEATLEGVIRVSCGVSFYSAVISTETPYQKVLEFVRILGRELANCVVAVTYGPVLCYSIHDEGIVPVLTGIAAERAHDLVVYGSYGKIYIDEILHSRLDISDPDVVAVCPFVM